MTSGKFAQLNVIIQRSFPLDARPYEHLASLTKLQPREIHAHIQNLHTSGMIREVSGIFDAGKLQYDQALIAMKLCRSRFDLAETIVQDHPGISHCYIRSDDFNFWFTLAVPRCSQSALKPAAAELSEQLGANDFLVLPSVKKFKLNVMFNLEAADGTLLDPSTTDSPKPNGFTLTDAHKRVVSMLQCPAPLDTLQPFDHLARQNDMDTDQLLKLANEMDNAGVLRRYCAVINHRRAGAASNVLTVWNVPEYNLSSAGKLASEMSSVSHCYHRKTQTGWPYNLYTMIHAAQKSQARRIVDNISTLIGCGDYRLLWTQAELKKQRLRFFQ